MQKLNSIRILTLIATGASFLTSCDNIPENERLIEIPKPEVKRNVLIQEFTGQRCPNCPEGAAAVHSIVELYGEENVIVVGMHPSGTSLTRPLDGLDLRNSVATAYFNAYNSPNLPAVIIDGLSPSYDAINGSWSPLVYEQIQMNTPVLMEITPEFNTSDRLLNVEYSLDFVENISGSPVINLWIVENGIVGSQYTNGPKNPSYVHNHVLRGSLTGDWGTSIGNAFMAGDNKSGSASINLNASWVAENCNIVAFVQDSETKFVYQVVEVPVIKKAETPSSDKN